VVPRPGIEPGTQGFLVRPMAPVYTEKQVKTIGYECLKVCKS